MERKEAIEKLSQLKGQDLRVLADNYGITVDKGNGKKNKGWAGHVIERYLGLPQNSSRAPNFGSWELKSVPLKILKNGLWVPKETMAVTMLDEYEVKNKPFEDSHLYTKLRKALIVSRTVHKNSDTSVVHGVTEFDLDNHEVYDQIKKDYDDIRESLLAGRKLSGKMGVFVQPRTKGAGHGSTSRAFYVKTNLIAKLFGIGN